MVSFTLLRVARWYVRYAENKLFAAWAGEQVEDEDALEGECEYPTLWVPKGSEQFPFVPDALPETEEPRNHRFPFAQPDETAGAL